MYYKIPLDADLSRTSYRCHKEIGSYAVIAFNDGLVGNGWEKISAEEAFEIAPEWFEVPSESLGPSKEEAQEAQLAYLVMKAKGAEV